MIILDTTVFSEIMQPAPNPTVVAWLDLQPMESIWTTAVTVFEVRLGIALLAEGQRRTQLDAAFVRALTVVLEGRVLPFDLAAAEIAGQLAAARRQRGFTVDLQDTQIAGIAMDRRATIATRNEKHFADLDGRVINPWYGLQP